MTEKKGRDIIPKAVRDVVKAKFNGHCAYCGAKPDRLQIDHLVPYLRKNWFESTTGKSINDLSNLMPACFSCNNFKVSYDLEQFRLEISRQVSRARTRSVNFRFAEKFEQIQITESPIKFHFEKVPNE